MLLIYTNTNGDYMKAIEVSQRRYERPNYIEALENSIKIVFDKLNGKQYPITVTEVEDEPKDETLKNEAGWESETRLERGEDGLWSLNITNKPRD